MEWDRDSLKPLAPEVGLAGLGAVEVAVGGMCVFRAPKVGLPRKLQGE